VHGVGGFIGTILLGVFAYAGTNAVTGQAYSGLIFGDTSFFIKQLVTVIGASAYAFIFTYIMLIIINFFTKVRVSEEDEMLGLDTALHGEQAYDEGAL
jgi:Amt family ammonium transporter